VQRCHVVVQRVSQPTRLAKCCIQSLKPVPLSNRYGRSTGSPSEKGLRIDAQTALDYVKKHPLLKDTKVVIYGQSIGGCVSIALAGASGGQVSSQIREVSAKLDSSLASITCASDRRNDHRKLSPFHPIPRPARHALAHPFPTRPSLASPEMGCQRFHPVDQERVARPRSSG